MNLQTLLLLLSVVLNYCIFQGLFACLSVCLFFNGMYWEYPKCLIVHDYVHDVQAQEVHVKF